MVKQTIFPVALLAILLASLPFSISGQDQASSPKQDEVAPAQDEKKPMNLQMVLPIAEKAIAREGIKTTNYMLTGAVYLGDNRIFGAQPALGGDYKGLYAIIDSHKIKLPTWVITYSLFAGKNIKDSSEHAKYIHVLVNSPKEAVIFDGT